ncbi:hypothetical protein K144316041_p20210 (plasmid) [Clostridium tetani]|uniref:hypothetical protein n=1 Tax=Clostridium tetani TaxID=1513 RepID=UPI00295357ED|nr:hypothetical protein [Clostridium tetani]BDR74182.1 hypothetical protein K144316041_p20210 [Clostridium tetani]
MADGTVINPEIEIKKEFNTYEEYIMTYVDGFVSNLFSQNIITTVDADELQRWFASPDNYYEEINKLMNYYYITDGDIYQLYEMLKVLPPLNYTIKVFDKKDKYEKNVSECNKVLNKVKYKSLTRDIISQLVSTGVIIGTWLGNSDNPYLFIFSGTKYVFPKYRLNGEWVCVIDMEWFDNMNDDEERMVYFKNLSPYVTQKKYEDYMNNRTDKNKRYVELPTDRTGCVRVNTLSRNQRLGLPFGTQALFDKIHKENLKNMEKAIANKIIKNIVTLKIGSEKNPEFYNRAISSKIKKKILSRVKSALSKNLNDGGVPVIAIPEYVDLNYGEIQGLDGLKKEKFEGIDNDIGNAVGISKSLTNGNGGNYANGKLNLEILYRRIAVILEEIEYQIFDKLFNLILPKKAKDNFHFEFDKEVPLTNKERMDFLKDLHKEGYTIKPILDSLQGVEYQDYIEQSLYEIEELKLRDKIIPPQSSYTLSNDGAGKPKNNDSDNQSTIVSKDNGGNDAPDAGI